MLSWIESQVVLMPPKPAASEEVRSVIRPPITHTRHVRAHDFPPKARRSHFARSHRIFEMYEWAA